MNSFKHVLSLSLLFSLVIFSSCTKRAKTEFYSQSAQEITLNIGAEPATTDPRKARLLSDFNIIRTLNEGLFRINKQGITSEAIAKSYTVSEDGKTYEIELRETLWSNGDPLTAHDFIYSWKSSLDKNFASPGASFLFAIKNGEQIKKGLLPLSMLGARTDGDYKIILELEQPMPYFIELLSMPIYFPIHQGADIEGSIQYRENEKYICNGPFTIGSWKHKDQIVMQKNSSYWDKKNVALQKITMIMVDEDTAYNLYQNKEVTLIGSPFSKIPSDAVTSLKGSNDLKTSPFLGTYWIRTNTDIFPLNNKNFRKCLASSINRKDLVEYVLSGNAQVATGIVPNVLTMQEKPYFKDDAPELALSSLDKACKELSLSKRSIPNLTFTYIGSSENNKVAAVIQDGWKKNLGIEVLLEPLEHKVYIDRISKGDYQLALGSWIADFKDPINFLEVFKTKAVGTNNTGWESLDYISAINASYEKKDSADRRESLITAEALLLEDMPVIPVYHTTMVHMQDSRLKDVVRTETGNIDFKWAYLSDK